MATTQMTVPLYLSGNMTEQQTRRLQEVLSEAVHAACRAAMERMDRQSAQCVLELEEKLRDEVADTALRILERRMRSNKYRDEDVGSNRVYPSTYRVRSIEAQVSELRKLFPNLATCQEKLARHEPPDMTEGWFAIPRWQALADTYNDAVEIVLAALGKRRRLSNRIAGKLSELYLRQTERSKLAEKILTEQQPNCDILVVAAQAGMLHRGSSARRTRVTMAGNEFGLGVFALGCLLLTHPERLSSADALMIDCGGDEYSVRGDYSFDRVPLFDYDLSGIEFSVFYADRARNLWGTPTGFLYKIA